MVIGGTMIDWILMAVAALLFYAQWCLIFDRLFIDMNWVKPKYRLTHIYHEDQEAWVNYQTDEFFGSRYQYISKGAAWVGAKVLNSVTKNSTYSNKFTYKLLEENKV